MERFSGLQWSGKLLPMKSGILVFEIRNSAQGIRNSANHWKSELKFYWQRIVNPANHWKPEPKFYLQGIGNQVPEIQPAKTAVFSSLFAAGDASRRGTSASQRQKFHTDGVKSVRNPVSRPDLYRVVTLFSYCLRMTDKTQKATKVKCKREESLTKQSIFVEYSLLWKEH